MPAGKGTYGSKVGRPPKKKKGMKKEVKRVASKKKKGSDGKACWSGYRYAGTKNGKDKCVPTGKGKTRGKSSRKRKKK